MKQYEEPQIKVIDFDTEEVLASSIIDPSIKDGNSVVEIGKIPLF